METPQAVIANTPITEQIIDNSPSAVLLFLIFIPTFVVAYLIPFLATVFSKANARKWIFYWIQIILARLILKPILTFVFGPYGGSFLFLVVAAGLVFISSNQKAHLLVEGYDIVANIVQDQWLKLKQKVVTLGKQYNLLE